MGKNHELTGSLLHSQGSILQAKSLRFALSTARRGDWILASAPQAYLEEQSAFLSHLLLDCVSDRHLKILFV
jgi:hypothetical protein